MHVYLIALAISMLFAFLYEAYVTQVDRVQSFGESRYIINTIPEKSRMMMLFLLVCSMLPLTLVSAFREGVGRDFYSAYVSSYYYHLKGQGYYSDEIMYDILESLLVQVQAPYSGVFVFSSFIIGLCYYISFFKFSLDPAYSVLLMFLTNIYFIGLNGVRQGIAMAISYLAIQMLKQDKTKTFVVLILIAVGFHKASGIFLILLLLRKVDIDVMRTLLILAMSIVGGLIVGRIAHTIIQMTPYAGYYESAFDSKTFEYTHVAIQASVLILYSFYLERAKHSEYAKEFIIYYWMQFIAVFFIFESTSIPLSKRICWYMTINQLGALPIINKLEESLWVKMLITGVVITLFALSIYIGVVINGAHNVLPYKCIFF